MTSPHRKLTVVLTLVTLAALVVAAHAAQKLVVGQVAGGGGGAAGGGLKLVGSVPASPAGTSAGGGLRLTGGFAAAAQTWADATASADAVANAAGMVTALTAVDTPMGAQITFSLSAPATVEVRIRNLAGRPIRTVTPGQACPAGLNTLLWSGMSDLGLAVPNGLYLVEVRARSDSGAESRALSTVQLAR